MEVTGAIDIRPSTVEVLCISTLPPLNVTPVSTRAFGVKLVISRYPAVVYIPAIGSRIMAPSVLTTGGVHPQRSNRNHIV